MPYLYEYRVQQKLGGFCVIEERVYINSRRQELKREEKHNIFFISKKEAMSTLINFEEAEINRREREDL